MAHVGVLRAFTENNIPIDYLAGTSAGSIVAGAYASGMTIDEIDALGRSLRWRHVGMVTMSRFGVQSNVRLENYLRKRLPVTRFEDLKLPLAVVATDLKPALRLSCVMKVTCLLRFARAARFRAGMCPLPTKMGDNSWMAGWWL
jgi:NTE family protein